MFENDVVKIQVMKKNFLHPKKTVEYEYSSTSKKNTAPLK